MMDNLRDYITTIETGKRPAGGAESSGVPSLSAEHMDKDGHLHFGSSKMKYVSEDYYETLKTGKLRDGDIVLVKDGATTGKVAFVDEVPVDKACINEHCFILRANENLLNEYLFFYLFSPIGNARVLDSYKGATIGGIGKSFIDMPIRVPSLEKQKQIVSILRKQRHIIALYNRQLESLDSLIKSRFVEMFGDPLANPKKWDLVPLLELGNCKNGMNFHNDDYGIEIHCLGVGDFKDYSTIADTSKLSIVELKAMPSADYFLENEDIVFVRSNGNKKMVGRSVLVYPQNIPTIYSGFCIRFRKTDDRVNVFYLLHVLKADSIRQLMYGRGANIQNLNQQTLASIKIPVPPIYLQNKYIGELTRIDKSKAVIQKSLNEAQLLFDSLMQEYFG